MPPAERVVAFVFSHDEFRARPPAPFYRLAGPATWDACSIDRERRRTIVTRVPKAKGRRDYGVAARGRAAKPDIGGGVPFARRDFFRCCGIFPLQTACRCVCRGGRIGHVATSRHVRYVPAPSAIQELISIQSIGDGKCLLSKSFRSYGATSALVLFAWTQSTGGRRPRKAPGLCENNWWAGTL